MEVKVLSCILVFSLLLSTIPESLTLPYRRNLQEEDHGKDELGTKPDKEQHTERIRFERETQESTPIPSTTPTVPVSEPSTEAPSESSTEVSFSTDEPSEGSTTEPVSECDEESRQASSCRSLKERLLEHFDNPQSSSLSSLAHGVQNSFSLYDLKLFDLLGEGRPTGLSNTPSVREEGENRCIYILKENFRPSHVEQGICSYNFSCTYDVTRFPALRIEANLINPNATDDCDRVLMHDVVHFERQDCVSDPCRQENWVRSEADIVVGFKLAQGYVESCRNSTATPTA